MAGLFNRFFKRKPEDPSDYDFFSSKLQKKADPLPAEAFGMKKAPDEAPPTETPFPGESPPPPPGDAFSPIDAPTPDWPAQGACRILVCTTTKFSVPEVGKIVADRTGQMALDVRTALARSPTTLAANLDPGTAESLATEIRALGVPVAVLSEADCPDLPSAERATAIAATDSGTFVFSLPYGDEEIDPTQFAHAHYGMLQSESYEAGSGKLDLRALGATKTFSSTQHKKVKRSRICDLYLFDPARRIRLTEGEILETDLIPATPHQARPAFQDFAWKVLCKAPQIPVNPSLHPFVPDSGASPMAFDALHQFESCAEWLFVLAWNRIACQSGP